MNLSEKVSAALKRARDVHGKEYPRHTAERKSLVIWIHEDWCHHMAELEEIERVLDYAMGG